jgi:hypothetical protein
MFIVMDERGSPDLAVNLVQVDIMYSQICTALGAPLMSQFNLDLDAHHAPASPAFHRQCSSNH